jgi:hypothetical protein
MNQNRIEKVGNGGTRSDLRSYLITGSNQSDFIANYAKNTRRLQSFSFYVPTPQDLSTEQKRTRHKVFKQLLNYLENKQFRFRGQISPSDYLRESEVLQDVPRNLYAELKKRGKVHLIFENHITDIPGTIANALICQKLSEQFSEAELRLCGVFVKTRDFDINGESSEVWRFDIDAWRARQGFIVPQFENKLITGLQVFRYPNDKHPFILRARVEVIDYTGGKNGSIA